MKNLPIPRKIAPGIYAADREIAAARRIPGRYAAGQEIAAARGIMKLSEFGDIIAAAAIVLIIVIGAAVQAILSEQMLGAAPPAGALDQSVELSPASVTAITGSLTARESVPDDTPAMEKDQARVEPDDVSPASDVPAIDYADQGPDYPYAILPSKRNLAYLGFYVYSEVPIEKPADIVLNEIKDIPVGTPVEEIKRASDAFGLNFSFMKAVAKVESDFDPKQRTGSYIGLFQLSRYEFNKFGSGDILDPRDNAVAAAYKFIAEATMFEWWAHKRPTINDLYLIHQQGWQGAAEHIAHPERTAWKSMCATDEGKEKGEKWCKRAIWGNTLPTIKHLWKTVDNVTSGEFTNMWRQRLNSFYSRYSEAEAATAQATAK
jgi:hypothetical protein